MGVEEVYGYLKTHKGFHTAAKISNKLGLNEKSIRNSLGVVARYDDIVCEYIQLIRDKIRGRIGLKTKRTWVYAHVNRIKKQRR